MKDEGKNIRKNSWKSWNFTSFDYKNHIYYDNLYYFGIFPCNFVACVEFVFKDKLSKDLKNKNNFDFKFGIIEEII